MIRPWLTLVPALLFFTYFLGGLPVYGLRCRSKGPLKDPRIEARTPSRLLPNWLIYYLLWAISPIERALVRLRVLPNLLTFAGLLGSTAGAVALALGLFDLGGWAYLFVGILDILDGRVARATGRVSRSGAFYDSVIDRYAEFAIFAGLLVYYRESWVLYVIIAAMTGSFMVSYTRARAEGLGVSEGAKVGVMQRPERVVFLGVALALSPFVARVFERPDHPRFVLAVVALLFVALTANWTALGRFWAVFRHLRGEDASAEGRPLRVQPNVASAPSGPARADVHLPTT